MKKIFGRYNRNNGVTTVFCDGTIYEIVSSANWGTCAIGERSFFGFILTKELYENWENECEKTGTFELEVEE